MVAKKYYDIELTDEKLGKHWGEPHHLMVSNLYDHRDESEKLVSNFLRHEDEFPKKVHDQAVATIEVLLEADLPVGVVTSMTTDIATKDLSEQGFPWQRFFTVQGSDKTTAHKPDPQVFEPALAILKERGVTDGIVYVGDALSDLLAAKAAGLIL